MGSVFSIKLESRHNYFRHYYVCCFLPGVVLLGYNGSQSQIVSFFVKETSKVANNAKITRVKLTHAKIAFANLTHAKVCSGKIIHFNLACASLKEKREKGGRNGWKKEGK